MRKTEVDIESGPARLKVCGPDSRAQHKARPVMIYVYVAGEDAEFELTRGECKDLRDALIKALDATEGK